MTRRFRDFLDQSQCFQHFQGFSDRRAAHLEPPAEFMIGGEAGPIFQSSLNDKLADFADTLLDNGIFFDGFQPRGA